MTELQKEFKEKYLDEMFWLINLKYCIEYLHESDMFYEEEGPTFVYDVEQTRRIINNHITRLEKLDAMVNQSNELDPFLFHKIYNIVVKAVYVGGRVNSEHIVRDINDFSEFKNAFVEKSSGYASKIFDLMSKNLIALMEEPEENSNKKNKIVHFKKKGSGENNES